MIFTKHNYPEHWVDGQGSQSSQSPKQCVPFDHIYLWLETEPMDDIEFISSFDWEES